MAGRVGSGGRIARVIAAIVGVAIGAFVVSFAFSYWRAHRDWGAQFDQLLQAPATAGMFIAFRDGFPADYARFRGETIARLKAGAPAEQIRLEAFGFMRQFSLSHQAALAQAPHAELATFRTAQLAAAHSLERDAELLCAHFAMNGLEPGDRPGTASVTAINAAATAQFRAVAAGTNHPAGRAIAPTAADVAALTAGMRAQGLADADVQLGLGGGLPGATPAQQCRVGNAMLGAVAVLPADTADRFTAAFVSAH